MGYYTGIRFKGYVKPEFRDEFDLIAKEGNWAGSDDYFFQEFGKNPRAKFIPCGMLDSMPYEWEQKIRVRKDNIIPLKGEMNFEREWDKESGYWVFQCSLKNYSGEIEQWFELIPYFIEKIIHLEKFYEEWTHSERYDLIDDEVKLVDEKFNEY